MLFEIAIELAEMQVVEGQWLPSSQSLGSFSCTFCCSRPHGHEWRRRYYITDSLASLQLWIHRKLCPCCRKYYIRHQIEQVFDICKNNTNLLPLRVHSEDTFRGHLVLAFTASVIVKMLQDSLKKSGCSVNMALYNLGLQHCKVFDDVVLPYGPVKKVNDILKTLKIKCPLEIRTVS